MTPGRKQAGQGHGASGKQSHLIQRKELIQVIPRQAFGISTSFPKVRAGMGVVQGAPLLAAAPAAAGVPM